MQILASHGLVSEPQTSAERQYPDYEDHPASQLEQLSLGTHLGYEDDTMYQQYNSRDSDYTHEKSSEQGHVPAGHTPDAKKGSWSRPRGVSEPFRGPSASYSGQAATDSPQTPEFDPSYPYDVGGEATGDSWSQAREYGGYEQDVGSQQMNMGETVIVNPPGSVGINNKDSKSHQRSSKTTKPSHNSKGAHDLRDQSKRGPKKEKRK